MSLTPEQLKQREKARTLPKDIAQNLTILAGGYGEIYSGGDGKTPTGYANTVLVTHLEDPENTFDLPIRRAIYQVALQSCTSYEEVALRLSRVACPATASWVRSQVQARGIPLYFATRHDHVGFDDGKPNEWMSFKSYREATTLNERRLNQWLKSQGSKYRIVGKRIQLYEK